MRGWGRRPVTSVWSKGQRADPSGVSPLKNGSPPAIPRRGWGRRLVTSAWGKGPRADPSGGTPLKESQVPPDPAGQTQVPVPGPDSQGLGLASPDMTVSTVLSSAAAAGAITSIIPASTNNIARSGNNRVFNGVFRKKTMTPPFGYAAAGATRPGAIADAASCLTGWCFQASATNLLQPVTIPKWGNPACRLLKEGEVILSRKKVPVMLAYKGNPSTKSRGPACRFPRSAALSTLLSRCATLKALI